MAAGTWRDWDWKWPNQWPLLPAFVVRGFCVSEVTAVSTPASGSQLVAPQPRKRDAPQGSERRDERRDLLESKLSRAAAVGEQRGDPLDKSHHRRHLVNLFSKSPGGRLVITVCPQNLEANYLLVGSLKNIITVTSPSSLDKVAEV